MPENYEPLPPPRSAGARFKSRTSGTRWFWAALIVMVAGFAIVVHERDRIRARWWAWQLTRSADLSQQAHYLGLLMGVGQAGAGAVESLSRHDRAEVRALTVVALARLRGERGVEGLRRLLADEDADVAESAALGLAFLDDRRGLTSLVDAVERGARTAAAAAAAALARSDSPRALETLCRAASCHADALVRAQAVESLAAWLMAGGRIDGRPCDPVAVLVAALDDGGEFEGRLSLERQIAAAEAATRRPTGTNSTSRPAGSTIRPAARTVGEAAAENLERLTGRRIELGPPRTAVQQAELAAQCRAWLRERRSADPFGSATQPVP